MKEREQIIDKLHSNIKQLTDQQILRTQENQSFGGIGRAGNSSVLNNASENKSNYDRLAMRESSIRDHEQNKKSI